MQLKRFSQLPDSKHFHPVVIFCGKNRIIAIGIIFTCLFFKPKFLVVPFNLIASVELSHKVMYLNVNSGFGFTKLNHCLTYCSFVRHQTLTNSPNYNLNIRRPPKLLCLHSTEFVKNQSRYY